MTETMEREKKRRCYLRVPLETLCLFKIRSNAIAESPAKDPNLTGQSVLKLWRRSMPPHGRTEAAVCLAHVALPLRKGRRTWDAERHPSPRRERAGVAGEHPPPPLDSAVATMLA